MDAKQEIELLQHIVTAFEAMDDDARDRALAYLIDRYCYSGKAA